MNKLELTPAQAKALLDRVDDLMVAMLAIQSAKSLEECKALAAKALMAKDTDSPI